jgi:large subunit ribosomal protein L9
MQVILLEKVINLGQLGEIVKVKNGFARNYLIPHGKAKRATEANIAEFEKRRGELEKVQADALAQAQERAAKLDGLMVQITQKAGVDGKLFGSVTNVDIAEALKAQGFEVPKAAIRMPQGPIKQVGDQPLKIALHADAVVTITVSVLGEQQA